MGAAEVRYLDVAHKSVPYLLDAPGKFASGVLFIPGVSGNALDDRFSWLSRCCVQEGLAVLRADVWSSREDLEAMTLGEIVVIYEALMSVLRSIGCKHIYVVGKSFGSAIGMLLCCDGYIVLSPAFSVGASSHDAKLGVYKSTFEVHAAPASVASPILIMQGDVDDIVSVAHASSIVEKLPHASLLIFEGADHSFAGFEDVVEQEIVSFLRSV